MSTLQKITPFLWFDGNAKDAATYYCDVFPESKLISENPFVVQFELMGQQFATINGGPQFHFTEAVSFLINCKDQKEVDYYWDRFIRDGGTPSKCGWLKDKFGLSWQVIPESLPHFIANRDQGKAGKATQAMLQMSKINIDEIEKAFNS
ncbi:VOC family protein [Marinoscillum sp. MHG1-6]|uniref:VOC family protein n=1 Tax=Marinoscillum sp. MHG1-6 TaxID=2959627 RepID=UPI002158601E|nr:VOC family protein [Marinoscillum sp. MHG1-6]